MVHDKYLAKVTPETKFIKDPNRKPKCGARYMFAKCELSAHHSGRHEDDIVSWSNEPESSVAEPSWAEHEQSRYCEHFDCGCPGEDDTICADCEGGDVENHQPKPTWETDKNVRRRSELRKLNAAASRLSNLAAKRLARIKELEAEKHRLVQELKLAEEQRDYYKLLYRDNLNGG